VNVKTHHHLIGYEAFMDFLGVSRKSSGQMEKRNKYVKKIKLNQHLIIIGRYEKLKTK